MAFMYWDDELSVNINEIDQQHQNMLKIINTLYDAMNDGKGRDILNSTISELIEYTKIHFATEETYMKNFGFPEYDEHKLEHEALTARVIDFADRLKTENESLSVRILIFLKDWLLKHIMKTDMRYSNFLISEGVR